MCCVNSRWHESFTCLILKNWKPLDSALKASRRNEIQVFLQVNISGLFDRAQQLTGPSWSWNWGLSISWAQSSLLLFDVTEIELRLLSWRHMVWCPRAISFNSYISRRVISLRPIHESIPLRRVVIRSRRHEIIGLVLIHIWAFRSESIDILRVGFVLQSRGLRYNSGASGLIAERWLANYLHRYISILHI